MSMFRVYMRALSLLSAERTLAATLVGAGSVIAMVLVYEQVLFGRVVDAIANRKDATPIILQWAGLGLFSILAGVLVAVMADRLAHRKRLEAMRLGFERSITLPISYHSKLGTGAMGRTILEGANTLFGLWLSFLREQTTAFVGIVLLVPTALYMNWRLAALLGALAVVYAILNVTVIYRTTGGQDAVERYHISVAGQVGDVIGNVTVVQSYARLVAEANALKKLMGQLLDAQYPVLNWWGLATVLARAASTITMVAVFAVGAALAANNQATVGEIVSFVGFAQLLISKLDNLSGFVTQIFMQTPTLKSYFGLLDAQASIVEKPGAPAMQVSAGAISYRGVTFQYGPGEQGVFDVDLDVPAGKTVALVGPTGAGKTTTLALLQRLRDPEQGRILIDGQDIREVTLNSLRGSIAVVFQDAGLFNRTIAENIRVGRQDATDEEVQAAARLAEAHEFIVQKPGGYEFMVGERGLSLSGGERQRIAIARAILKNAPILILDEATSALDTETEGKIKRALDAVRKNRTTLIIAHRLSTVANADEILVFDKGRIIERGTFAELTRHEGLFARLVSEGGFLKPKSPEPEDGAVTDAATDGEVDGGAATRVRQQPV